MQELDYDKACIIMNEMDYRGYYKVIIGTHNASKVIHDEYKTNGGNCIHSYTL